MNPSTPAIILIIFALAGCGQPTKDTDAPATPPALQWIPVAQTGDGGAIQYDPAQTKIDATSKLVDVVVRIRHPYLEGWTQELPKAYSGETVFQTEQATLRFDCGARTMGVVSREALAADGSVLDKRMSPEPITQTEIAAGGVAEAVFPKVCTPPAP